MALYIPDHKYIDAKRIVENLGDSEKDEAIKYYIEKHQEWHDKDKKQLEEYHDFFEILNNFLPNNNNNPVYG